MPFIHSHIIHKYLFSYYRPMITHNLISTISNVVRYFSILMFPIYLFLNPGSGWMCDITVTQINWADYVSSTSRGCF